MATGKWYGPAIAKMATKQIDWTNDTIKVALVTSTYTPDQDAHDEWADVSANEVSGTGYTAGGKVLSGKTLTYDSGTNTWTYDASDALWNSVSVTFRYAVIYDDTAAGKPLLGYIDFTTNRTATAQNLTIKWESGASSGILKATV